VNSVVTAIDTSVFIGAERALRAGAAAQVEDARCLELLKTLEEEKTFVVIPAIAAAEYLTGGLNPPSEDEVAMLLRSFPIAPFDAKAAIIAAQYTRAWRLATDNGSLQGERSRGEVKADIQLVATAVAAGAAMLYTMDDKMHRPPAAPLMYREPKPFAEPVQLFN
jgi:predicted nucleic acid-binding protein